jgi:hypothetical protein
MTVGILARCACVNQHDVSLVESGQQPRTFSNVILVRMDREMARGRHERLRRPRTPLLLPTIKSPAEDGGVVVTVASQ